MKLQLSRLIKKRPNCMKRFMQQGNKITGQLSLLEVRILWLRINVMFRTKIRRI